MQQKYSRLQDELRTLAQSMREDEDTVLTLLNKHIMDRPRGKSMHASRFRLSRLSEHQSVMNEQEQSTEEDRLSRLLNELFEEKCRVIEVFPSEDRKRTFIKTLRKKNEKWTRLDLSICNLPHQLSSIISRYVTPKVTRIDLSQNELSLPHLTRIFHSELTELVLSNCGLHNETFELLFEKLSKTPLVRLCLSSPLPVNRNILTKYDKFYEFILATPTLNILEMASLQISHYEQLFKVCSKSNIESLDLSGNDRVRGIYAGLQVLKLKNNSLDKLNQFSQIDGFPLLYHIDLSNNQLNAAQFNFIFKSKPQINLRVLIADENALLYKLENFEHYISMTSWLETLSMKKCRIGEEGMRQLIYGVGSNTDSLKRLDLSNNRVSREACGYLAEALKTSGLKELILVECEITDEGGQKVAMQLKYNTKLEHLNLTQNRLNMKTGRAFVTVLHTNHTINKLNLSRNAIPYDSMKEILSSVDRNHYLKVKNFSKRPPNIRVSLPQSLIDEQQKLSRQHAKLKSQLKQLKGIYDEIHTKSKQVGEFQQPPEFENDGTAQAKYLRKLQSLQTQITKIQRQKNFLINNSARNTPTPTLREQPSHRTNTSISNQTRQ